MRRAASLRSQTRSASSPSAAAGYLVDDLGIVREEGGAGGSGEDELRRVQRENERLRDQLQAMQTMMSQRPSLEQAQELQKEYANLDLILQGTQRENERCMAELERAKQREKTLEGYLTKLVGENWQTMVGLGPAMSRGSIGGSPSRKHSRSGSLDVAEISTQPAGPSATQLADTSNEARAAQLEQIRMLVLGMDQRLQTREEVLSKALERAEAQATRYQSLAKEMDAVPT